MSDAIAELIGRLEKLGGPDRESDGRIYALLNNRELGDDMNAYVHANGGFFQYKLDKPEHGYWAEVLPNARVPRFTSSLDAAVSLVPDGWKIANLGQDDHGLWWCELRTPYITSFSKDGVVLCPMKRPSAALALCMTALKARQENRQ